MSLPKIEKLLTPCNFTNKNDTERIKYIVIHYVGALGGAEENCRYYATKYIGASAHYFVGFDGEIWQSVRDGDIAWHCGAKNYTHPECRNSNSIGIEMCVRKKDTSHLGADDTDWYFEQATVESTRQLVLQLMKQYNIPKENVLRHYDVTGKCCPNPYVKNEAMWDEFMAELTEKKAESAPEQKEKMTKITGKAEATAEQMEAYIKKKNPDVPQSVVKMIPLYLSEGEAENIRGDVSFAQSCLETGNYTFEGSAVELEQNNFCGMGVLERGMQGNVFETPQLGIRAQTQHLKAYANTAKLKQECVDPRFEYVSRGCAPYVEYLGIRENPKGKGWASGAGYGEKILRILEDIKGISGKSDGAAPDDKVSGTEIPPQAPEGLYMVTTICDVLRIRAGAGLSYPVVGRISEKEKKKQYTIMEEKNGWGRLKSGAGWIKLSYTKKVS